MENGTSRSLHSCNTSTKTTAPSIGTNRLLRYIPKKQAENRQVAIDIPETASQIVNQDALNVERAKSLRMRGMVNDDERVLLSSAIKPFAQRSYPIMKKVKRELQSVLAERQGWKIFWFIILNVLCSFGLFVYSGTTNSLGKSKLFCVIHEGSMYMCDVYCYMV